MIHEIYLFIEKVFIVDVKMEMVHGGIFSHIKIDVTAKTFFENKEVTHDLNIFTKDTGAYVFLKNAMGLDEFGKPNMLNLLCTGTVIIGMHNTTTNEVWDNEII